jgi:hypothetical protein
VDLFHERVNKMKKNNAGKSWYSAEAKQEAERVKAYAEEELTGFALSASESDIEQYPYFYNAISMEILFRKLEADEKRKSEGEKSEEE